MPTRRDFVAKAAAASVVVATAAKAVPAIAELGANAGASTGIDVAIGKTKAQIKKVVRREDTLLRYGGDGDNWHMSWAADDRQYLSLCDGAGFSKNPRAVYNSRMLILSGGPGEATFEDLPTYPVLGTPLQTRQDARYYNFGTLALDGSLYQFMSTFNRPFQANETSKVPGDDLLRFVGAKLIYSPNNGRTWHNQDGTAPVVWESWPRQSRDTLAFFREDQDAFSLLTVLQMGKNYEHNRDGYVYVYAPNGNTEGTMNELVMFRVPKQMILDRRRYEYFAGIGSNGDARWTSDITSREPVCVFPRGWVNSLLHPYAWHPSVVYNAPLDLYLMANWGIGTNAQGMWFSKPSYLGFWIAGNPWGPWTQIHEEVQWLPAGDKSSRAYQPQIAPKWIAPDGKSFWLVWTDYKIINEKEWDQSLARYKADDDPRRNAEAALMRSALRRKYMPYYSFNAQRVDLLIT